MTAPTYLQVNSQFLPAGASLAASATGNQPQQTGNVSSINPANAINGNNVGIAAPSVVTVNPVVYLSIVDHHLRRNTDQQRVIGTLLGVRSDDGTEVEVRNCFPVPHAETGDQVAVDMEYHQAMYELNTRVSPNETIVGWYATGSELNSHSALIHDFYQREAQSGNNGNNNNSSNSGSSGGAVHLLVDTGLAEDEMPISAFVGAPTGVPVSAQQPQGEDEYQTGLMFVNIPVKHLLSDKTGLTILTAAKDSTDRTAGMRADLDSLEHALKKVKSMIETVSVHVHSIVNGKTKGSPQLAKLLLDVLASIPQFDSASFEKAFADHLQDILMIVHLSNLTRTQLAIAERLQFL